MGVSCQVARLAQSVERKALNLVVVGSSPTVGVTNPFSTCHLFCRILEYVMSTLPRLPYPKFICDLAQTVETKRNSFVSTA